MGYHKRVNAIAFQWLVGIYLAHSELGHFRKEHFHVMKGLLAQLLLIYAVV